jgi:hypothetical protein
LILSYRLTRPIVRLFHEYDFVTHSQLLDESLALAQALGFSHSPPSLQLPQFAYYMLERVTP